MLGRTKTSKYSKMQDFSGKEEREKIDNCIENLLQVSISFDTIDRASFWADLMVSVSVLIQSWTGYCVLLIAA